MRRESFSRYYDSATPDLAIFEVKVYSYSGEAEPSWARNKQGDSYACLHLNRSSSKFSRKGTLLPEFSHSCTIEADLDNLSGALEQEVGIHGDSYWSLIFDVCIRFGGTELEAYLEWKENVSYVMCVCKVALHSDFLLGSYSY